MGIEEILAALLANAAFRTFMEELVLKVLAEIFHRRTTDPEFLSKSDKVFAEFTTAKTEEDQANAQKALQALMAS